LRSGNTSSLGLGESPEALSSLRRVLLEERMVAYLDPGAEWVLTAINRLPFIETTSSCMGRISLIEGQWPWERRGDTRIVYKAHSAITPARLALEASKPYHNLWLKVTGPILHLRVSTASCARAVLDIARRAGFKHSGIISIEPDGGEPCCVVEITSPTQLSTPVKLEGRLMFVGSNLELLVHRANRALAEGRRRLVRLVQLALSNLVDTC
jgi:tRNA wybutosine-synthesizing protein 3